MCVYVYICVDILLTPFLITWYLIISLLTKLLIPFKLIFLKTVQHIIPGNYISKFSSSSLAKNILLRLVSIYQGYCGSIILLSPLDPVQNL